MKKSGLEGSSTKPFSARLRSTSWTIFWSISASFCLPWRVTMRFWRHAYRFRVAKSKFLSKFVVTFCAAMLAPISRKAPAIATPATVDRLTLSAICRHCSPVVVRAMPGLIRVVALHRRRDFCSIGTKVLLVDDSAVADDESLDTGDLVLGGPSHHRKSANHHAVDHVVKFSVRRSRALTLQNFEIVAVERLAFGRVTLLNRFCDCLANRTFPASI